jgi:hypothetical protein
VSDCQGGILWCFWSFLESRKENVRAACMERGGRIPGVCAPTSTTGEAALVFWRRSPLKGTQYKPINSGMQTITAPV